jgi:hypothetical protein
MWFVMRAWLVWVCADFPTEIYMEHVLQRWMGIEWVAKDNFVVLSDPTNYADKPSFLSSLQSKLSPNLPWWKLHTFIVSQQAVALANQLWLTVEADMEAIRQWNNKMNIIEVLWKNDELSDHIMYWESFEVSKWVDEFVSLCKRLGWNNEYVWVKMPESVAWNWVFKFEPNDTRAMHVFWEKYLSKEWPIEWIPDGRILIQQHMPHLVWFYNVMTKTSEDWKVDIVGSWLTRQILDGESHIGNNQLLGNVIDWIYHELPHAIQEKMTSLAKIVSQVYYKQFWSTGYSGIDFGLAYESWVYKIRIMEVNDRVNGCYSLHYAYDMLRASEGTKKVLTSMNIPLGLRFQDNQIWVDEALIIWNKNNLITPEKLVNLKPWNSLILPIAFSWTSVLVLIWTWTQWLKSPKIIACQHKVRGELLNLLS